MNRFTGRVFVYFGLFLLFMAGCGSGGSGPGGAGGASLTAVSVEVGGTSEDKPSERNLQKLSEKPVPAGVASISLGVKRGETELYSECKNVSVGNDPVLFDFEVPPGTNTDFSAQAFSAADCAGNLLYEGQTIGVVLLGEATNEVKIHLGLVGVTPPTVTTLPATDIGNGCARLHGRVQPQSTTTIAWFDWGSDPTLSSNTLASRKELSGNAEVPIEQVICGLSQDTLYHFRTTASNGGSVVLGEVLTFSLTEQTPVEAEIIFGDQLPPVVVTNEATDITATSAIVHGTIDPEGSATQGYIEFGETSQYGNALPLTTIGNGFEPVAISANLTGLTSGKVYNYRVVGFNSAGLSVGANQTFQAQSAILSINFEAGIGNISISNGTWEIGKTTSSPSTAHSGESAACTVLNADYPDNVSSRMMLSPVRLPSVSGDDEIHLIFYHWFIFGGANSALGSRADFGRVQVREEISPGVFGDWVSLSSYSGASPEWTRTLVDLSAYAGNVVQIGFLLDQGFGGVGPGWCVDSLLIRAEKVRVLAKAETSIEDFEPSPDNWSGDNGTWRIGVPIIGPMAAHSGVNVAGTVLDRNYSDNTSSRLVSPSLRLPSLTAGELLKIRFWHWFQFGGANSALGSRADFGRVQIREELSPGSWGAWSTLESFSGASGVWTTTLVDVPSAFAGKKVQIGFLLDQGFGGVGAGWFVDTISMNVVLAP